ncbi:MAG: squalene/phytoene synthase family protein [Pseudomonadota bacterium]
MLIKHYENFPIASYYLPRNIRPAILAIYRLARHANDVVNDTNTPQEQRLKSMEALTHAVTCAEQNQVVFDNHVLAVAPFMKQYHLSWFLWQDLLSALKQNVIVQRYISYDHLLNYCARSANSIGRLIMPIYGIPHHATSYFDALCTALQLISFWQNIAEDEEKGKRYLPDHDVINAGLSIELSLGEYVHHFAWAGLIEQQLQRAENLLYQSAPLLNVTKGRIRWELAMAIAGGARIIYKIRTVKGNVFAFKPQLGLADTPILLYDAIQWIRRGSKQYHDSIYR